MGIRDAVKAAISSNPQHLKGEAIAMRMGVSTSALYSWGDPAGKQIPIDRLIQLCLITGDPRPIAALANACGYDITPRGADGSADCREESIHIVQTFAALLKDSSDAILDSEITPEELRKVQTDGSRAMLAIARLIGAFERGDCGDHRKAPRFEQHGREIR